MRTNPIQTTNLKCQKTDNIQKPCYQLNNKLKTNMKKVRFTEKYI